MVSSNPIRRLFLKSIPLDLLLRDWLRVRSLKWLAEEDFPPELRRQADEESFLARTGGDVLGDRRDMRIGLVCADPAQRQNLTRNGLTRSERLQHLEDLQEYLRSCGRHPDEFEFFRPTRFDFQLDGLMPLFLVLWSADAPLLERVLSGRRNLPGRIKEDRFAFRELKLDDPFVPQAVMSSGTAGTGNDGASPGEAGAVASGETSGEASGEGSAESSIDSPVEMRNGPVHYALVGSVRGTPHRKMFVRLAGDRLFLVYFSSKQRLSPEYVTAFIDSLASASRPVYRLEDHLLQHPPESVNVTVLEVRGDRQMEILSWGLEHAFLREGKSLRFLRDQKGRNLHIVRLRINPGDRLLLLPAGLNRREKSELATRLAGDLQAVDVWLNGKGIGRTLVLSGAASAEESAAVLHSVESESATAR